MPNDPAAVAADVRMALRSLGAPCVAQRGAWMPSGPSALACWTSSVSARPAPRAQAVQAAVDHRQAGGVVTAAGRLAQTFQKDRDDVAV
jgi:hypothetical protein